VTTGVGAVLFTAKVEAGANVVVFGLGGIGLNVIQGAKLVGANRIIGVDVNPAREAMARKFGMTDFVNPKDVANVVDEIVRSPTAAPTTASSASATRRRCARRSSAATRAGGSRSSSASPRRRRDLDAAVPARHRAGSGRARRSAARAAAATCRGSSTGTWTARSRSTSSSRTAWTLDDINRGFELMKRGESIRSVVVY
jgi:S-(hydroxymethyl)glutathione dehydrogenase/alcohol dehydrogenase